MAEGPSAPASPTRPATVLVSLYAFVQALQGIQYIVRACAARVSQDLCCRRQCASLQQQQGLQRLHLQGEMRTLRAFGVLTVLHWCQCHQTGACLCEQHVWFPSGTAWHTGHICCLAAMLTLGCEGPSSYPPASSSVCAGGRFWVQQDHEWAPDSPHKELRHRDPCCARAADAWQAHKSEAPAQESGAPHLAIATT